MVSRRRWEEAMPLSVFKWETLKEVGPHTLPFKEPVSGKVLEVELTSGHKVEVFRADDGLFYFCHGLTFGGKDAPEAWCRRSPARTCRPSSRTITDS
jgi:hypothetical protein